MEVQRTETENRGATLENSLCSGLLKTFILTFVCPIKKICFFIDPDDQGLLVEWLNYVNEKNTLQRLEADLNMRAKELDLESQHSSLQRALRSRMASSSHRNFADLQEEQKIIEQMLSVVQERDRLVTQLEMERRR